MRLKLARLRPIIKVRAENESSTLNIDSHHPLFRANKPVQDELAKVQGPSRSDSSWTIGLAVQNHLYREAAATDQDIDLASVQAIQDAIRDGRLEVRADRIADGLIASLSRLTSRSCLTK